MTAREIMEEYGVSLSTAKRYREKNAPVGDKIAMLSWIGQHRSRAFISKKMRRSAPAPIVARAPEPEPDLLSELNQAISDLISAHFEMVKLAWNDPALRARLKPVFDCTRKWIEEPSE